MIINKKICVFGATGFIGSAIVNQLDEIGIDWVGISRSDNNNPRIIKAKLEDRDRLFEVLNDYPVVINAMGSFKPADFESNTKTVFQHFWNNLQLFSELLSQSAVTELLHISSGGTVYGETDGEPATETDWLKPISWYGKAKVIEESMLEKAALQAGFKYTCARVSNPFGNSRFSNHGFIDVLLNTVKNDGVFNTFNNPDYSRDFIHCVDLAKTLIYLLEKKETANIEIFNVGSGVSTSLHEILRIAKTLKPSFNYNLDRLPTDFDVVQSALNINKLTKLGVETSGFKTVASYLEEGLMNDRYKDV